MKIYPSFLPICIVMVGACTSIKSVTSDNSHITDRPMCRVFENTVPVEPDFDDIKHLINKFNNDSVDDKIRCIYIERYPEGYHKNVCKYISVTGHKFTLHDTDSRITSLDSNAADSVLNYIYKAPKNNYHLDCDYVSTTGTKLLLIKQGNEITSSIFSTHKYIPDKNKPEYYLYKLELYISNL